MIPQILLNVKKYDHTHRTGQRRDTAGFSNYRPVRHNYHYLFKEAEKVSIGENIARLRKERGLTQRDLAADVGVNQSMIAQIERGTKAVTYSLAKEIAEVLNVDIRSLDE